MNKSLRFARWGVLLLVVVAGLFILASPVSATEFRDEAFVNIPAGEVIDDDLLVFGQRIIVDGVVEGDLIASVGEELVINGRVDGSVAASGTKIVINGDVDGSLYVGAAELVLGEAAEVGRNVYAGAGSVTAAAGSSIGRSVYTGAYQVILNGDVARDVNVSAAALEVNGTIGGDLSGEVSVPENTFWSTGFPFTINGTEFDFVEPGLRVSEGAVSGEMTVSETIVAPETDDRPFLPSFTLSGIWFIISRRIGELIALLFVGALIIRFWPAFLAGSTKMLGARPGESVGWGFLLTLVFPLVILAAIFLLVMFAVFGGLITFGYLGRAFTYLGSATIGMVVALFGLAFFMLSKIVVTYMFGKLLLGRNRPEPISYMAQFGFLTLGVFLYEIVRAIPILGAMAALVVILFGMGAMFLAWRERRAAAVVVEEKPVLATATE